MANCGRELNKIVLDDYVLCKCRKSFIKVLYPSTGYKHVCLQCRKKEGQEEDE